MITVSLPDFNLNFARQECQGPSGLSGFGCQERQGTSGLSGAVDNFPWQFVAGADPQPIKVHKTALLDYRNINKNSLTFVHFLTNLIACGRRDQVPLSYIFNYYQICLIAFANFLRRAILVRNVVMDRL